MSMRQREEVCLISYIS